MNKFANSVRLQMDGELPSALAQAAVRCGQPSYVDARTADAAIFSTDALGAIRLRPQLRKTSLMQWQLLQFQPRRPRTQ